MLPVGLRALGCTVDVVPAYRTVAEGEGADALRRELESGRVDAVTFASASAVRGYVDAVGMPAASRAPAVTIGPVTSVEAMRAAAKEGVATVREGGVCVIDARVMPGYDAE